MVCLDQRRFLNSIIYAYFFCAGTPLAHSVRFAANVDSFDSRTYVPETCCNYDDGLNRPCGENVQIKELTQPFVVGEGPFWSTKTRSLYFVDGAQSTICRYAVHTRDLFCAKLGEESVQFIIPFQGLPGKFLTSYGANLTIVTWDATSNQATFESLRQPDSRPTHFVNDAKATKHGSLFFVTEPKVSPKGLDSVPPNQSRLFDLIKGVQAELVADLSFGNGIGFSCDERFVYFSDSITNCTYESCYDPATNSMKHTRVLIDYVKRGIPCFPDSMTVDAKGYIWTTCNRGSRVLKVEPKTGRIVCSVKLPAVAPTNVAFGECPGERDNVLKCLYVTSERIRLSSPTPYDGVLYVVKNIAAEGYPPNKVRLSELIGVESPNDRFCAINSPPEDPQKMKLRVVRAREGRGMA